MDRAGKDHVRGERAASANPIIASNQHQKRSGGEGRNGPSPPNSKQTRGSGESYQICSKTECRAAPPSAAGGGNSEAGLAQRSKSASGQRPRRAFRVPQEGREAVQVLLPLPSRKGAVAKYEFCSSHFSGQNMNRKPGECGKNATNLPVFV